MPITVNITGKASEIGIGTIFDNALPTNFKFKYFEYVYNI